jgi:SAM-dependent methyltransferase
LKFLWLPFLWQKEKAFINGRKRTLNHLVMKKLLAKIYSTFQFFGFDVLVFFKNTRGIGFYFRDYRILKKQKGSDSKFNFGPIYPILNERFSAAGKMSGHYFHQDLLVAKKIYENQPIRHLDIGSRTDGFIAHLAVFRKVEIIDIRDLVSTVKNIEFRKADLMQLPNDLINCCDSISSLHVIEHFGLGRYGDPIDYDGYLKAIENITKILQKGGKFYFSVPIGNQRIEFNAHRVFAVKYLLELLLKDYTLNSFSYVNDKGNLFEDVEMDQINVQRNFGCHYGCGIFELTKI